jgi:hypothetical protein
MSLFPFFRLLPYMFRAFISPSSGVSQVVVYMQPFGSCVFLLIICMCLRTGLWWWCSTVKTPPQTSPQAHADDQQKRYMNQMVAYKQQLEYSEDTTTNQSAGTCR